MSRPPFWQPGDKWQPPIVRLKGVDEKSPVGQQLLNMYEGRIKQFYLGQARAHALGISGSSRGARQFPDARMTYTNMMGQEIVDVEVRPDVVEDVTARTSPRAKPNWAVINFLVPVTSTLYAVGLLARPAGATTSTRATYGRGCYPWFAWGDPPVDAMTGQAFAADATGFAITSAGAFSAAEYAVSLLVDLRPYQTEPNAIVTLDVFGLLVTAQTEQVGWRTFYDYDDAWTPADPDSELRALSNSGWEAAKADWLSRGYGETYDRLYDGSDGTELGNVADLVLFEDMPEPGPTKTTAPLFDPYEHYRYQSVERDPTTGLVITYFNIELRKISADGSVYGTVGPSRSHFYITEAIGQLQRPRAGPGQIQGALIWGNPTWSVEQQLRAGGFGYVNSQYRWHPQNISANQFQLRTIREVSWPTEGITPTQTMVFTRELGSAPTKLGLLSINLDPPTIAFAPAS